MDELELDIEYDRVVAERRAKGAAYWASRFGEVPVPAKSNEPGPLDFQELPVTPAPSSKAPRFEQPKPRRSRYEAKQLTARVMQLRDEGKSLREIAAMIGAGKAYVDKIIHRQVSLGNAIPKRGGRVKQFAAKETHDALSL